MARVDGRLPTAPGSREPDPSVPALRASIPIAVYAAAHMALDGGKRICVVRISPNSLAEAAGLAAETIRASNPDAVFDCAPATCVQELVLVPASGTEARSDETEGLGPQGDGPARDSGDAEQ